MTQSSTGEASSQASSNQDREHHVVIGIVGSRTWNCSAGGGSLRGISGIQTATFFCVAPAPPNLVSWPKSHLVPYNLIPHVLRAN